MDRSQKMVATGKEIEAKQADLDRLRSHMDDLSKFKPETVYGKADKREDTLRLISGIRLLEYEIRVLRHRLEVETADFLSGAEDDTSIKSPRGLEKS